LRIALITGIGGILVRREEHQLKRSVNAEKNYYIASLILAAA
jgi:hypothetical protein